MGLERDPHVMPSRHALDVYWSSAPTNPLNHLAAALYHTQAYAYAYAPAPTHLLGTACYTLHDVHCTMHTAHCTLYFGPLVTVGGSGQLWSSPRTPHLLNPSPLLPSPDRTHYQATVCLCPCLVVSCRVVSTPVKSHPHRIQSQTQTSLAGGAAECRSGGETNQAGDALHAAKHAAPQQRDMTPTAAQHSHHLHLLYHHYHCSSRLYMPSPC
jgi:hypothetical protein